MIEITNKTINEHIEKVLSLLKQQKYFLQGTLLTREERSKLFQFFYMYDKFGMKHSKFEATPNIEEQSRINETLVANMDEEIRAIVKKCEVDAKEIFTKTTNYFEINPKIFCSMVSFGIATVGNYIIEATFEHPIDRDSLELKTFSLDVRQRKYETYKDGEATFRVFNDINGVKKQVYFHSEGMHFGGMITFMNKQIGGNFGMAGFSFSAKSGMMNKDVGISTCINDLMPFFETFEETLSQAVEENPETSKSNNGRQKVK